MEQKGKAIKALDEEKDESINKVAAAFRDGLIP